MFQGSGGGTDNKMVADDVDMRQTFEAVESLVYILMQTVNSQLYLPANRLDEMADTLVKLVQMKMVRTCQLHLPTKAQAEAGEQSAVPGGAGDDGPEGFLLDVFERLSARVDVLVRHVPVDSLDLLEKKLVNLVLEKKAQRLALQMALQMAVDRNQ
jgi:hypothetical protein